MTDPFTILLQHAAPELAADLVQTYRSGLDPDDVDHAMAVIEDCASRVKLPFVEVGLFMLQEEEDDTDEDRQTYPYIKAAIVKYILSQP